MTWNLPVARLQYWMDLTGVLSVTPGRPGRLHRRHRPARSRWIHLLNGGENDFGPTVQRLLHNRKYVEGVAAQAFYVGAQIMCWTFIIQYAGSELGMEKAMAQNVNIAAMLIFVSSRFICTFLLKFFSPGGLLMTLAVVGFGLILGTMFIPGNLEAGAQIQASINAQSGDPGFFGYVKGLVTGLLTVDGTGGLLCLVGVSACMSLMFPTIYGIALKGLGDDAKLGAAGLIMAIGGGCLMPPIQAAIMDLDAFDLGLMVLSSARASFVLPLICFAVIAIFGFRTSKVHGHQY
jgi:MFS transporter, FHS family, L-fucose permease